MSALSRQQLQLAFFALALGSSLPALGARRKRAAPAPSDTVTVQVPESPIERIEETSFQHRQSRLQIEASLGYSAFDGLRLPSYAPDATRFRQVALPSLSLRLLSKPFLSRRGLSMLGFAGVGIQAVERTGSIVHEFARDTQTQRMTFLPATLGLELGLDRSLLSRVQPVLEVMAHPFLAITNDSLLDEGRSLKGITGEVALGARIRLSSTNASSLVVMLGRSLGSTDGADFGAYQLSAAARLPLDF